jgi:hypothetical protein
VSKPYGVRFLVALPVPGNSDPRAFRPLQKTTFTVTDVIKRQRQFHPLNEFFVEVTWEDGRKGYVATKRDGINPFDIYGPLVYSTMYNEIIYEKDPDIIRAEEAKAKAREEQKRVAAAKAWKARGGVRVGMTKADVLNSNWGRPNSVNKTTTKNGTYEQWVYDGGYLYFDNGVVISIQN